MVHTQRTSDEKRPARGRRRINPREFATTGPRTPETAANYLLHRGLRQDSGGDQRAVSNKLTLCMADPDQPRPRQFKAEKGSAHSQMVFTRQETRARP
ncbi:MAG: hypothetical protein ACLQU5_31505 [Isosphaeraceae bacterium]